ncbi:MAG: CoB--CoM heterodisulfide reductase iron-sulfur subunit B family protein [Pseudomonadota bacterium]
MSFALFLGCQIPNFAPQYEKSSRLLLKKLGIKITDMEFNCCGYPLRHQHFHTYLLAAARNLALAEAKGLDLMTLCKCCLGSFKRAQAFLAGNAELLLEVNQQLAQEGLAYRGHAQVRHLQTVLHQDVGLERLSEMVVRQLKGLRVATLYGCHALRPSKITGFDNPYAPHIIDDLMEITGATSVPWAGKLKCCGAPLRDNNEDLSLAVIGQRLKEYQESGADVLNVDCPHTLLQIKWAFKSLWPESVELVKGVVLSPQLLGLALGLAPSDLGLDENRPRAGFLGNYLAPKGVQQPPEPAPKAKLVAGAYT